MTIDMKGRDAGMIVELFIDRIEEELQIEMDESEAYGFDVQDFRAMLREVRAWRKKYPKKRA